MSVVGWASARLEELATKVGSGATPRGGEAAYKKSGTPLIRSMNVVFFGFKRDGLAFLDEDQAEALKSVEVSADDVLLNITGASIGRVTLAPDDLAGARVNQHVCIIRPTPALDPRFLNAFLSSPAMQNAIAEENYGVTRQALTKQQILDIDVPVPPLPEQKRIADKLDALLARVDACRGRLDRVPRILKRFRQSVLAAATSGELTREWRQERGGSADVGSWASARLVDLCVSSRVITYGVIKLGDEAPHGVPCLRTSNVRWLRIDMEGMKRIAPALSAEFGRTVLQGGEVLVNVRGTLGGVAVAESTMRGWNVSREVAVVPVDCSRIDSQFLAFWIGSDDRQRWLSKVEKGVAYTGINIEDLRTLPVSVPPLDEQLEIVRRVQALLSSADELELRHKAATRATEPLTASLLAMAFRGDLVPQDPNDEPASKLLARVRTRPDSAGNTGKPKRSGTRGSRTKAKADTNMLTRKDVTTTHLTTILKECGALKAEALWAASQLEIDDFYDQLKDEEARGLLRENRGDAPNAPRVLEPAA